MEQTDNSNAPSMRPIESLQRGLAVLREVGKNGADIPGLVKATGINRTTIYRILMTLEHEGYLVRSPSDHRFRLAPKIKQLSDGFTDALWVTHIAMPILQQLLRDIAWPGNVVSFDGRNMVFRESTHRFSSYLVHRPLVGTTAPMASALGQAYLAFSTPAVRTPLLGFFREDWEKGGYGALTSDAAEQQLSEVRDRGYAIMFDAVEKDVAGVAMPVIRGNQVLACFGVAAPNEVMASNALRRPIITHLSDAVKQAEREMDKDLY